MFVRRGAVIRMSHISEGERFPTSETQRIPVLLGRPNLGLLVRLEFTIVTGGPRRRVDVRGRLTSTNRLPKSGTLKGRAGRGEHGPIGGWVGR